MTETPNPVQETHSFLLQVIQMLLSERGLGLMAL